MWCAIEISRRAQDVFYSESSEMKKKKINRKKMNCAQFFLQSKTGFPIFFQEHIIILDMVIFNVRNVSYGCSDIKTEMNSLNTSNEIKRENEKEIKKNPFLHAYHIDEVERVRILKHICCIFM